jgi:hypothetical protein
VSTPAVPACRNRGALASAKYCPECGFVLLLAAIVAIFAATALL